MDKVVEEQLADLDSFISDEPVVNEAGEVVTQPEIDTKAFMRDTLMMGFGVVASRAGAHWALSNEEAESLAEAYDGVVSKYFPNAGKALGVEVTAITITAMVFLPRYQQSAAMRQQLEVESSKDEFGLDNPKVGANGN